MVAAGEPPLSGRIAGVLDRNYNEIQKDNAAFYGFFECVNDPQASRELFESMFAWARQRGARRVLGPMNPTANDECGLLVDGFDSPPVFMMTYNPRYYVDLVAAAGFRRAVYYPYGFLADNAESELEGRVALRARPELEAVHLPCLNAAPEYLGALAGQIVAG